MNALELADKLEQDPSEWGGLGKVAWPAAAMLRNLHTENMALRCTEAALRDEIEPLRRQLAARVPDAGYKTVPAGREWLAFLMYMQHPTFRGIMPIEWAEAPEEVRRGWLAKADAMLSAAPAQPERTNCRHCGGPDNVLCAGQCKHSPAHPEQPAAQATGFDEWWDSSKASATPNTYRGWEESCRQAWEAGQRSLQPAAQGEPLQFECTYGYDRCAALKAANIQQASKPMTEYDIQKWQGDHDVVMSTKAYRSLLKLVGAERHHKIGGE